MISPTSGSLTGILLIGNPVAPAFNGRGTLEVNRLGSVANFCRGRTKTLIGTSSGLSDRFELELLIENLDRLGQSRQTQAEGALDDTSLATNVIRDVEG